MAKLNLFEKIKKASDTKKAERLYCEGLSAYGAKDYTTALPLFETAAELGNLDAQFYCAVMYRDGEGTVEDPVKARMLIKKAAEQGHARSQYSYGMTIYYGTDTEAADKARALTWFEKSAEQGYEDALLECGMIYREGLGTEKNPEKAEYWFNKLREKRKVN